MCTIDRRHFLGGTLGGFFAYALRNRADSLFAQESAGRAKRCVVLWMNGGPSQMDTFDPKPGVETGGPTKAIETAARGVRIAESLPEIARRMKHLSVVRSIGSKEGDHLRGQYLFHTGHPLVEGFAHPAVGSMISKESPESKIPKYVTLGAAGFGPAYLGAAHAPFSVEDAKQALESLRAISKKRERIRFLRALDQEFDASHPADVLTSREEMLRKIEELSDTPFVRALDLAAEPSRERDRYGASPFGQRCLTARRLLEAGVNFVEVHQDGWDTHVDNFSAVGNQCRLIDAPWAALMDDLEARGLLDETVVVWMGEFGRTPSINARNGRDHYPRVTCAVVGGGGIAGGRVVGETDRLGATVMKDPVTVPDLFATLFSCFGLDPKRRFRTEFGGTATLTDGGSPIRALL
ncbi:MAG TPA: DUF1501 domain-containing protein [Planctomycetota bacterium]|nr:DUF1501 domain-containing protein [Planctomycetota bacterium]